MKKLVINLNKELYQTQENEVVITSLESCTLYAKRAESVTIISDGITRKLQNYLLAFQMMNKPFTLIQNNHIFQDEHAINHASAITTNRAEHRALTELRTKTWSLIIQNNIPKEVYEHVDEHTPSQDLAEYDITIGQQMLPVAKATTYKPTDLQRNEWGVSDKDFIFSKEQEKYSYKYVTTLYDKLLAYLQLQYYKANDIPKLFEFEDEPKITGAIIPVSECDLFTQQLLN